MLHDESPVRHSSKANAFAIHNCIPQYIAFFYIIEIALVAKALLSGAPG
jgi:hypothetical protein